MNKALARILTSFIPYAPVRKRIRKRLISKESTLSALQSSPFDIPEILQASENGNHFVLIKEDGSIVENPQIPGLKVEFNGTGHYCKILGEHNFKNCLITFTENNGSCVIDSSKYPIFNLHCTLGKENSLLVGKDFSCFGCDFRITCAKGTKCVIGDDCMFAERIMIRSGDGHAIFNKKNKILNFGADVIIANHVWIGYDVKILKGSNIPDYCIVGAGSLVTQNFKRKYCILAGNPAKIIKKHVNWSRKTPDSFI